MKYAKPRKANGRCSRGWRSQQQTRAAVFVAIQEVLENLPQKYSDDDYRIKCEAVYQHMHDLYYGVGRSVYAVAG